MSNSLDEGKQRASSDALFNARKWRDCLNGRILRGGGGGNEGGLEGSSGKGRGSGGGLFGVGGGGQEEEELKNNADM